LVQKRKRSPKNLVPKIVRFVRSSVERNNDPIT